MRACSERRHKRCFSGFSMLQVVWKMGTGCGDGNEAQFFNFREVLWGALSWEELRLARWWNACRPVDRVWRTIRRCEVVVFYVSSRNGLQTTFLAFCVPCGRILRVLIDQNIVDVIIGEMMFHRNDTGWISRARLLTDFVTIVESSEEADDNGSIDMRLISVISSTSFWLRSTWPQDSHLTGKQCDCRNEGTTRLREHWWTLWVCLHSICSFYLCNEPAGHREATAQVLDIFCHAPHGNTHGDRVLWCPHLHLSWVHCAWLSPPVHPRLWQSCPWDYLQHFFQVNAHTLPALAHEDNWMLYGWREKDDGVTPRRDDAHPTCSKSRVHANLVRRSPARLAYAVVLSGHSRLILFIFDIACSIPSWPTELHF